MKMTKTARLEHGQALVEFALVVTFLIPMMVGLLDLGRAVYAYGVVANAAQEGARYGTAHPTDTAGIQTHAEQNTVGLDPSLLTVSSGCSPCDPGVDATVNVTVTFTFQPVTPFGPFNLTGSSRMTIE